MSIEKYLQLRAELLAVRARAFDAPEEDDLLGMMDDAWWDLPPLDQKRVRSLLAGQVRSVIHLVTTIGPSAPAPIRPAQTRSLDVLVTAST